MLVVDVVVVVFFPFQSPPPKVDNVINTEMMIYFLVDSPIWTRSTLYGMEEFKDIMKNGMICFKNLLRTISCINIRWFQLDMMKIPNSEHRLVASDNFSRRANYQKNALISLIPSALFGAANKQQQYICSHNFISLQYIRQIILEHCTTY